MPTLCFIIKLVINFYKEYKQQTEYQNINEKSSQSNLNVDKQIILPPECMKKIVQYTVQGSSRASLFTLLFVNRYWCESILQILWKNPFRFLFPPSNSFRRNSSRDPSVCYGLLRTYIACLDDEEYYSLFSKLNPLLHPFIIQIPNSFKTLYNYPMYLERFSYGDLENTIYTSFMMMNSKKSEKCNYQ